MKIRRWTRSDLPGVERFLEENGTAIVARLGKLMTPLDHPGLLAENESRIDGVLTYVMSGERCEVLTLHVSQPRTGVGSLLLEELERVVRAMGCKRLWLITTNDNVDALRFYQRRGFHLVAVYPGAVDVSRQELKPEISHTGSYGIPLSDELLLEKNI
jgi:N-acetylglutamate synthase-like GNAT family acetyltransferase